MNDVLNQPAIHETADIAETISSLQNLIERNATELKRIKDRKKEIREQETSLLENDPVYTAKVEEAEAYVRKIKEEKARVKNTPEAQKLKLMKQELSQEEKEIKQTLSNHLTNYYAMTNSKSFDTSSGEVVEFKVNASIGSKQLRLF